jgi:hypothetical protein
MINTGRAGWPGLPKPLEWRLGETTPKFLATSTGGTNERFQRQEVRASHLFVHGDIRKFLQPAVRGHGKNSRYRLQVPSRRLQGQNRTIKSPHGKQRLSRGCVSHPKIYGMGWSGVSRRVDRVCLPACSPDPNWRTGAREPLLVTFHALRAFSVSGTAT